MYLSQSQMTHALNGLSSDARKQKVLSCNPTKDGCSPLLFMVDAPEWYISFGPCYLLAILFEGKWTCEVDNCSR